LANRYFKLFDAEFAPYLRCRTKKRLPLQIREMQGLWSRYRCPPYHYFKHRLYERGSHPRVLDYVPPELVNRFQRYANPKEEIRIVADKVKTNQALAAHGVAHVATLFSVDNSGRVMDPDGRAVSADIAAAALGRRGGDVFIKPIDGGVGYGASVRPGAALNPQFFETARNIVIQPVIRNHPDVARIFAGCLNTVRIDTLIDGEDCVINAALLKVGTGAAQVDNWSHGAIAMGIDLRNGALSSKGLRKYSFGRTFHEVHPDTGVRFEGIVLPLWHETLELARRAAFALRPHVTLGWDIAITPEGPVAIEANETGDFFFLQEACGPLVDTRLAEVAMEHWKQLKVGYRPGGNSYGARARPLRVNDQAAPQILPSVSMESD
jgi:hypothetical protein